MNRRPPLGRLLVALVLFGVVFTGLTGSASAHPLGNFTVNRYARVEVSAGRVRVYYVLDEAEIPALQEGDAPTRHPQRFTAQRVAELGAGLRLSVDGTDVALRAVARSLDRPPGQGGLKTLRVAAIFDADLPGGRPDQRHRLQFTDGNEPSRIGWREIVTVARGDGRIESSTAPSRDVSDELRSYPGDLIQAPLDLRAATVTFTPGTQQAPALAVPRSAPAPSRSGGAFADLITRHNLDPVTLAGMLGLALLLGAGHALLPGHGKTVMAAYLVGTKGRPVDAVLLGVIVSVMHTLSVLVLGLVLFRVSRSVEVDRIYPQLTIASGLLAMTFGACLLITRARKIRRTASTPSHDDHHDHDHDHDHDQAAVPVLAATAHPSGSSVAADDMPTTTTTHHHHHDHHDHHHGPGGHTHELPEDVAPLSRRGLIVLATSGGIVPSPSAVIVVISAFSLGRATLGLTLIAAFSIGLAATLSTIGLALVLGRSIIERRWPNRSLRYLPIAGAATLIALGAVLVSQGITSR